MSRIEARHANPPATPSKPCLPWLLAALAWLAAGPALAQVPTNPGVGFATVGGRALLLDVYLPATGTTPRPLVIWLHDGGWLTGDRTLPAFVAPLLQRNVAIASIDYRLTSETGRYGNESVTFPAQIHDVKAAIRFMRANAATYGIDPARIGVWGSSAGGHLAALAGASGGVAALEGTVGGNLQVSSRVQAVVDYYGPTDLLNLNPDVTTPPGSALNHDVAGSPGSLLIGFSGAGQGVGVLRANASNAATPFPTYRALARDASPLTFVDARDPPFMIVHGTADPQVAIRQSERLRDALLAVGATPRYVPVPGAGHGGFANDVHAGAIDFLATTLGATSVPIGNPAGLAGAWYDPASAGQGIEVQWLAGDTLLVVFYGHRDDGGNLFLIGTRTGLPRYGETLSIPLTATSGGRFNGLDPAAIQRVGWGSLTVSFASCDRATAVLQGADGTQNLALERLIGPEPPRCD